MSVSRRKLTKRSSLTIAFSDYSVCIAGIVRIPLLQKLKISDATCKLL